jgi:hypothetical protein
MFSLVEQYFKENLEIPHIPHEFNNIHLFEELIVARHEYFVTVSVFLSALSAAAVA